MKTSEELADFGVGVAFALPFIVAAGLFYLAWHLMLYLLGLLLLWLTPVEQVAERGGKRKGRAR